MSDSPKRVYWDSCVWIAFIQEEKDRAGDCKYAIDLARNKSIEIWTSSLCRVEVLKAKCDLTTKDLDDARAKQFEEFLEQDFVFEVALDADIANVARTLFREHAKLRKPVDAMHLATAVFHNVDEMHTYDEEDLLHLNGKIIRRDGKPLVICKVPPPPPAGDNARDEDLFGGESCDECRTTDEQLQQEGDITGRSPPADAEFAPVAEETEKHQGIEKEKGEKSSEIVKPPEQPPVGPAAD